MTHFSTNTLRLLSFGLALTAAMLTGCAKKPPDCADPDTLQTIHSMVVSNVKDLMPQYSDNPSFFQDDPAKIQDGYYKALKTEVVNVVSNGYNESAKKNSCKGKLTVLTQSGGKFSRDIEYSTQVTQDKEGGFLVEVQAFLPFVSDVVIDLANFYQVKRFAGEWRGNYSCAGLDGAQNGPQGPFSMPVTLVVNDKLQATLERTTQGGGTESLKGTVGQKVELGGIGQDSTDGAWRTYFEGEVKGIELTAQGKLRISGYAARPERNCTLNLQLGGGVGGAPTAGSATVPTANACIAAKMDAWSKAFEGRESALIAEAERENREFHPTSMGATEEFKEAALQKAKQECP